MSWRKGTVTQASENVCLFLYFYWAAGGFMAHLFYYLIVGLWRLQRPVVILGDVVPADLLRATASFPLKIPCSLFQIIAVS